MRRRELLSLATISLVGQEKQLRILVLCTGNSPRVNPFAIAAMKELGLDISNGT